MLVVYNETDVFMDFDDKNVPLNFRFTYPHSLYGDIVNQFVHKNSVRGLRSKLKCTNQNSNRIILCIDPNAIRSIHIDIMAKI
jgi:hypothetical protein